MKEEYIGLVVALFPIVYLLAVGLVGLVIPVVKASKIRLSKPWYRVSLRCKKNHKK